MIRYNHNTQFDPPAPLVLVTLRNPKTGQSVADQPAQIDHAADFTVLPLATVDLLHLVPLGEMGAMGLGQRVDIVTTFLVDIDLHGYVHARTKVIASNEPYVLLGRDILNQHRVVLDGPRLKLEIE
jgi:hypothetical protein